MNNEEDPLEESCGLLTVIHLFIFKVGRHDEVYILHHPIKSFSAPDLPSSSGLGRSQWLPRTDPNDRWAMQITICLYGHF